MRRSRRRPASHGCRVFETPGARGPRLVVAGPAWIPRQAHEIERALIAAPRTPPASEARTAQALTLPAAVRFAQLEEVLIAAASRDRPSRRLDDRHGSQPIRERRHHQNWKRNVRQPEPARARQHAPRAHTGCPRRRLHDGDGRMTPEADAAGTHRRYAAVSGRRRSQPQVARISSAVRPLMNARADPSVAPEQDVIDPPRNRRRRERAGGRLRIANHAGDPRRSIVGRRATAPVSDS